MKKVKIMLISLLTFLPIQFISAQNNAFYTNSNGIEMTETQYNYLLNFYSRNQIENMTTEKFNYEIDNPKILGKTEKKFIKTITHFNYDGTQTSYDLEITEDEYNNPISTYATCDHNFAVDCWETDYKELALFVWYHTDDQSQATLVLMNRWKIMPTVRSFDVIGIRYTGNFTPIDSYGNQYTYTPGVGYQEVNYSYGGSNMNILNNGIGISQNLLDSTALTELENRIVIIGKGSGTINIYGSYQHAQKDVTLAQSKSYVMQSNGLGGVFIFATQAIHNAYDNMRGVSDWFTL